MHVCVCADIYECVSVCMRVCPCAHLHTQTRSKLVHVCALRRVCPSTQHLLGGRGPSRSRASDVPGARASLQGFPAPKPLPRLRPILQLFPQPPSQTWGDTPWPSHLLFLENFQALCGRSPEHPLHLYPSPYCLARALTVRLGQGQPSLVGLPTSVSHAPRPPALELTPRCLSLAHQIFLNPLLTCA